jgi:hypothetical protein
VEKEEGGCRWRRKMEDEGGEGRGRMWVGKEDGGCGWRII